MNLNLGIYEASETPLHLLSQVYWQEKWPNFHHSELQLFAPQERGDYYCEEEVIQYPHYN